MQIRFVMYADLHVDHTVLAGSYGNIHVLPYVDQICGFIFETCILVLCEVHDPAKFVGLCQSCKIKNLTMP